MGKSSSTIEERIAQVASAFEQQRSGHTPKSVNVVLNEDMLVIAMRGVLSPAEKAMARSPAGAAQIQEYHRQLFANASDPLRQELKKIIGVEVGEATAEIETITGAVTHAFVTGAVVQVFLLAHSIPAEIWSPSKLCDQS